MYQALAWSFLVNFMSISYLKSNVSILLLSYTELKLAHFGIWIFYKKIHISNTEKYSYLTNVHASSCMCIPKQI